MVMEKIKSKTRCLTSPLFNRSMEALRTMYSELNKTLGTKSVHEWHSKIELIRILTTWVDCRAKRSSSSGKAAF